VARLKVDGRTAEEDLHTIVRASVRRVVYDGTDGTVSVVLEDQSCRFATGYVRLRFPKISPN
jgi:hypothetical protein